MVQQASSVKLFGKNMHKWKNIINLSRESFNLKEPVQNSTKNNCKFMIGLINFQKGSIVTRWRGLLAGAECAVAQLTQRVEREAECSVLCACPWRLDQYFNIESLYIRTYIAPIWLSAIYIFKCIVCFNSHCSIVIK